MTGTTVPKPESKPEPKAESKPDWRERRGAATREQILDAAVRCIVRSGYASLTTTMIAEAAKVSRGAMLHHFPSKEAIIHETVRYLFERRMAAFEKMVRALPRQADRIHDTVAVFWDQVHHPYFTAFFELTVAARTDRSLLAVMAPCQEALEARSLELAQELFPELDQDRLRLGLGLSQAIMESLALQLIRRKPSELDTRLIGYLEQQIQALYGLA